MNTLTKAAQDVLAERARQVNAEGWTPDHDDEHDTGELAIAAACYAAHTGVDVAAHHPGTKTDPAYWRLSRAQEFVRSMWPWGAKWWKPKDRRRNLVRAAALLLAEIERLDRASGASAETTFCNCARAGGSCVVRNGGRLPEPMRCANGVIPTDGGKS